MSMTSGGCKVDMGVGLHSNNVRDYIIICALSPGKIPDIHMIPSTGNKLVYCARTCSWASPFHINVCIHHPPDIIHVISVPRPYIYVCLGSHSQDQGKQQYIVMQARCVLIGVDRGRA